MSSDQAKTYKDFVDYQPDAIKLLSQDEFAVVTKYNVIIGALRDQIMTVKEIHDLYLVESEDGTHVHRVTQQSVYRYLEELEKLGIVTVVGYRKTEGVKSSERIYGRSAKIFTTIPSSELSEGQNEEQQNYLLELAKIFAVALGVDFDKVNLEKFVRINEEYGTKRINVTKDLFEKARSNDYLTDIFSEMSIEQINEAMFYVQQFIPLIENPGILNELRLAFSYT